MTTTEPIAENNYYRQIIAKTAKQHQLFFVHWELTYRCNQRCTHCYVVKPGDPGFKAPGSELSTEECKDIINQLADENALNIGFSGGEPLIHSGFFEIARYARSKQFAIRILTNGTLITPEVADKIAALYPVGVDMSVYGARAETHDGITLIPGSFERVMRAFRLLAERGVKTYAKTPLMRENIGEYEEIRALAEELQATSLYDITIVPKDNGSTQPLRHRLLDQELLSFFRQEMATSRQRMAIDSKFDGIAGNNHVCLSGTNMIAINPYGEVFPCLQVKISAGNLRRQKLRTVWSDAPILQKMRTLTISCFPICATCHLLRFCNHCPGVALLEDGDLLGPSSVACRETRIYYQVLSELERGEN